MNGVQNFVGPLRAPLLGNHLRNAWSCTFAHVYEIQNELQRVDVRIDAEADATREVRLTPIFHAHFFHAGQNSKRQHKAHRQIDNIFLFIFYIILIL